MSLDKELEYEVGTYKSSKKERALERKVILLGGNTLDSYLINKYLPKDEGWSIYECDELVKVFKFLTYLHIDLLIVDISNPSISSNIIKKLEQSEISKNIPKILLLDENMEIDRSVALKGVYDYAVKPLVKEIFTHRVDLMLKKGKEESINGSQFFNHSKKLLNQALDSAYVYQKIFLKDETIMAIYDSNSGKLIEANSSFERLFGSINLVNRVLSSDKAIKKYIPYVDAINFLNHYNSTEWSDKITTDIGFNYSLKVEIGYRNYSFHLLTKRIDHLNNTTYLLKFINLYDYIPQTDKKETNITLKEDNLGSFKEEFLSLRELLKKQKFAKKELVEDLIYKLSTKLSILCDDESIIENITISKSDDELIGSIWDYLENKYGEVDIKINGYKLDERDRVDDMIFCKIDNSLLNELLTSILSSRVFDIKSDGAELYLYEKDKNIYIEVAGTLAVYDFEDELSYRAMEIAKELNCTIKPVYNEEANKLIYLIQFLV